MADQPKRTGVYETPGTTPDPVTDSSSPAAASGSAAAGAMRSASQEGYDGPENLRNAVAAAHADSVILLGTHGCGTFAGRPLAVLRWPERTVRTF